MIVLLDESVKHQSRFNPCRIKLILTKYNVTGAIQLRAAGGILEI